ncbi:glycosyltransferase [Bacillus alkalicellulosilyticus]|uniref:glycosyltransferase n=1 Tax=Alkalihalobacterium alkalicellulosilyticum TaxID=1912214 RepID=UPI0009975C0C|nr:glycosyltransferase [Bacillus alkalicellulosilyticus]
MTKKGKVVHISTVHHPFDPRIYHKECKSLKKAGYDVNLIVTATDVEINSSSIPIIHLKKHNNRLLRMLFSTTEAFIKAKRSKADYYHIHDPELLPVAWLLKKKNNVVIYDVHEDYETSIAQKNYIPKLFRKGISKVYSIVEAFFSKKLEICLAEKYYREKYSKGICILNYPILNQELLNNKPYDMPIQSKVLYTGNVTIDRGAFIHSRLPSIDPSLSVYFIGRCPVDLADRMYEVAEGKQEQIIINGKGKYVRKEDIDASYIETRWLAGIALFPPTEHYMKKELTKFFEYMTAGLPIICSDFPVWKDFIKKYKCGIAVNPNDDQEIKNALNYIRNNPNEAKLMGENGKKAIRTSLNWSIEETKLIKWYCELQAK